MAERATNPFDLGDKVVIVTGGASGIGAGIAAVLAEAGATVVIADRDEAGARRAASTLSQGGRRAGAVLVDLADEASIVRACAEVDIPLRRTLGAGQQRRRAGSRVASGEHRGRMGPHECDQCARPVPDDTRDRAGDGGR